MESENEWKPDYTVTPQRVVCAANRLNSSGVIVLGARHCDGFMRDSIKLRQQIYPLEKWFQAEQGFIDQFGKYLSRQEAWVIASVANQIHSLVGGQTKEDIGKFGTKLFSENLY